MTAAASGQERWSRTRWPRLEKKDARPAVESYVASMVCMDTLVTIEVANPDSKERCAAAVAEAFRWFEEVEQRCSRFDPEGELSRLCRTTGEDVPVSGLLFRAIEFALAVARETDGAFDPAVGAAMVRAGFDTNYATGERVSYTKATGTFENVVLDAERQTVRLERPLVLDLGAVAKGLAIDLAAQALQGCENFAINAGGDLYLAGLNAEGEPWRVGIRHPRRSGAMADLLRVSGMAACTSGDYEREGRDGHHILGASGGSAAASASATVIAPSAMLADALATAAFVLGPEAGVAFLESQGVEGMLLSPGLERFETAGYGRFRQ